MNKFRNWFLTALLALGGFLDFAFGLTKDFRELINLDPKDVKWMQLAIVVIGYIALKMQPPSTNPDKLQKMVFDAEKEKL